MPILASAAKHYNVPPELRKQRLTVDCPEKYFHENLVICLFCNLHPIKSVEDFEALFGKPPNPGWFRSWRWWKYGITPKKLDDWLRRTGAKGWRKRLGGEAR